MKLVGQLLYRNKIFVLELKQIPTNYYSSPENVDLKKTKKLNPCKGTSTREIEKKKKKSKRRTWHYQECGFYFFIKQRQHREEPYQSAKHLQFHQQNHIKIIKNCTYKPLKV